MKMSHQQIGIQDLQGLRSVSNFPFEMPNAKGFFSQQPVLLAMEGGTTGQSLRTAAFCDISSSHLESRTEYCLNFPGFVHNISSWPQASEIATSLYTDLKVADSAEKKYVTFQSRDTLQSLVQSSSCPNQNTQESFEENFGYEISNVPEEKLVEFQQNHQPAVNKLRDWSHYRSISFQKNLHVENEAIDYYQGLISPMNTQERAAKAKRNRIRWTPELHNQFIKCVDRLGGAKKATPKGILKLMNCDGLTIFHIKSHLQKYRVTQNIPESKEDVENTEKTWTSANPELDQEMGMKILESLKMQIDVQRRLYEQLECQKDLQSRIEEQAQQLKKMFDHQVKTNVKPTKDVN